MGGAHCTKTEQNRVPGRREQMTILTHGKERGRVSKLDS